MDSLAQCHLWQLWETHPDVDPVLAGSASTLWLKSSQAKETSLASGDSTPLRIGSLAITAGAIILGSGLGTPALANEPLWGIPVSVSTPEGYALNVRWGPGTNNGVQRCMLRGSPLRLSGARSNGWVQLIDKTWVDETWVVNNLASGSVAINLPDENLTTVVIPGNRCEIRRIPHLEKQATVVIPQNFALNVRSGPGFDFPVVGQFLKDSRIAVTGQFCNGWAHLVNGNWVDRSRIEYSGPVIESNCPPSQTIDPYVKELQRLLIQVGYLPPSFVITGINDQTTQDAVRQFQRANGLPVTGTSNAATWRALYQATAPAPTPDENVRELQRLLIQVGYLPPSFVISGIYDQTTQNAVRQFQRANGLPVTGNVNNATWQALYLAAEQRPNPTPSPLPGPTPNPTPNPTPDPPPIGSRQMRVVTNGDSTSVYDGPGPEFGVLRDVPNGSIVTVTGRESGNWSELIEGGWIFSLWLDEI